jgi:hypothetical protein
MRWADTTPEQRREQTSATRRALVVAEIRRQIEKSRLEQGLPAHVVSEQFLQELSREVLGGDAGDAA